MPDGDTRILSFCRAPKLPATGRCMSLIRWMCRSFCFEPLVPTDVCLDEERPCKATSFCKDSAMAGGGRQRNVHTSHSPRPSRLFGPVLAGKPTAVVCARFIYITGMLTKHGMSMMKTYSGDMHRLRDANPKGFSTRPSLGTKGLVVPFFTPSISSAPPIVEAAVHCREGRRV